MYTPDFGDLQSLYEDRLREAEQHRAHNKLVRAAREYARREHQPGLLERVKLLIIARNQPQQETSDVRRAPAL